MKTNEHLAAAVDKLLGENTDKDKQIADLKTQLATAQAQPETGVSEADADAIITKIEAVTGPVSDPSAGVGYNAS